jgi:hypothetical protein
MLGKLAWVKVIAENRHTIFKLVKEAVFGRGLSKPHTRAGQTSYDEAAASQPQVSAGD